MTVSFVLLIGAMVCFLFALLEYQNQPKWNRAIAAGLVIYIASMLVR